MKKITIILILIPLAAIVQSCVEQDKKEYKPRPPKEKSYEEILADCRKDYAFYCYIGEDLWGSFERYLDFISVERNRRNFNYYLKERGYEEWDSLCIEWTLEGGIFCYDSIWYCPDNFDYDNSYIAWLYVKLREKGIDSLSYLNFKNKICTDDGFIWCYEVSKDYDLVDTWTRYLNNMLECKLEHIE